jgi:hypothetical protein
MYISAGVMITVVTLVMVHQVAELYAARLGFDSKELQSYMRFAMAVLRESVEQTVHC